MRDREPIYFGIAGFTSPHEVEDVSRAALGLPKSVEMNLGFLVSSKIVSGVTPEGRFVDLDAAYKLANQAEELKEELGADTFPSIHYNISSRDIMKDTNSLLDTLLNHDIFTTGVCKYLQLNIPKADFELFSHLEEMKKEECFEDLKVILQLSDLRLRSIKCTLEDDMNVISYALIDTSRGTGKLIDLDKAAYIVRQFGYAVDFAVAGGLNFENVGEIAGEIRERTGYLVSVDMESGVRDPTNQFIKSRLVKDAVYEFSKALRPYMTEIDLPKCIVCGKLIEGKPVYLDRHHLPYHEKCAEENPHRGARPIKDFL